MLAKAPSQESLGIEELKEKGDAFWELLKSWLPAFQSMAIKLLIAILIWVIGKKIIKGISKVFKRIFEKKETDLAVQSFLLTLISILLHVLLIFLICEYVSIATASMVAVLGSLGLTLGLALQGSLANVAGGILILITKPFKLDDYITDANGTAGTVVEIGLLYTKLRTPDNRGVIIPNGQLANGTIINNSMNPTRRVDIIIRVSYKDDLALAKSTMLQLVSSSRWKLEGKGLEPIAFIKEYRDSAILVEGRLWVESQFYFDALWEINDELKKKLEAVNISIPYNQLDVHIVEQPKNNR